MDRFNGLTSNEASHARSDLRERLARADIIGQIKEISSDRAADATTIELVRSIVLNADRLGLVWKIRPATVSTSAPDGAPRVLLDGSTQPIRCMSLLGPMMVGTRVMTVLSPPSGCHVIGLAGLTGWQRITLMNLWVNRAGYQPFAYRVPSSPPNSVQLIGNIGVGTPTNGIQIGLMPPGYRPLSITCLSCYGGQTPTLTPKIEIDTGGIIRAWDFTTAGYIGVNGFYPLDL